MKKYKAELSRRLRENIAWMLAAHIVFVFLEVFYYNFVFMVLAYELLCFWLCYYSYMTLHWLSCWCYIVLMAAMPVMGVYNIITLSAGSYLKPLVYVAQIGACVFGGVFKLSQAQRAWLKAKEENAKKVAE